MKALILCGGEGTRMRPLSYSQPKHLIPIANVPVIERILGVVREGGINEVGIVVSPSTEAAFEQALGNGSRFGVRLQLIVQTHPKGLAHAVQCGRDFVGEDSFLLYLGDNLLEEGVNEVVRRFKTSVDCRGVISLVHVDDPRRFGVARLDGETVVELIEKPADPPSHFAVAGIYAFDPMIFSCIERIRPSQRGELEITDAIQRLIDDGFSVLPHKLSGWWKDVGQPEDMIEANRLLLEQLPIRMEGGVDSSSEVAGKVSVQPGARVVRSRLIGPVAIAEDAVIEDSVIGPNVSVGEAATIQNSEIEESIIFEQALLVGISGMTRSLIGRSAQVTPTEQGREVVLVLGDQSSVSLPSLCAESDPVPCTSEAD